MNAIDRFLKYVTYDTQSDEHSTTTPSTDKQKVLGAALAEELDQMGLYNAHMDEHARHGRVRGHPLRGPHRPHGHLPLRPRRRREAPHRPV